MQVDSVDEVVMLDKDVNLIMIKWINLTQKSILMSLLLGRIHWTMSIKPYKIPKGENHGTTWKLFNFHSLKIELKNKKKLGVLWVELFLTSAKLTFTILLTISIIRNSNTVSQGDMQGLELHFMHRWIPKLVSDRDPLLTLKNRSLSKIFSPKRN